MGPPRAAPHGDDTRRGLPPRRRGRADRGGGGAGRGTRMKIWPIFKKEMRLYFTSPVAWVIMAVFLFIGGRSEEHTSELQSQFHLVCRLLLEKKKKKKKYIIIYIQH